MRVCSAAFVVQTLRLFEILCLRKPVSWSFGKNGWNGT